MRSSITFISAAALAAGVHGLDSGLEPPFPGAAVFVPEWEVPASPGGPTVTLTGTVQEVVAELEKLNPDFKTDFNITETAADDIPVPSDVTGSLEKRTDFKGSKYICNNYPNGRYNAYHEGVEYLRGVPGKPRAPAGPGACGRVSCSQNTAIWWCNDDRSPKELYSFGSIADGAWYLSMYCTGLPESWNGYYTIAGQAFHSTNWNVIVRNAAC
ncbi:hypothetical protein CT0861_02947 [Colletotrichum tofieldiae]|uniref:Secreted protein n=1 Tax=Colletotrichum tofieldiae TaxID=708197 RepID=A0A161VI47_9PEZI|nr:hypothetical protein CT0861_02947 [Colletotrichum tofieldiae]